MSKIDRDIDWAALTLAWEDLLSRSEVDRLALLAELAEADGAMAAMLTATLERTQDLGGFMLTRAQGFVPSAAEALAAGTGDRIGAWRLVSLIGEGGMGRVWLAQRDDGTYEQVAALKELRRVDERTRERFEEERRKLARMEHPGIARIIDGGADSLPDGSARPFMVMEHVEGLPVDRYATEHALDRKARAALLVALCRALAHAHARLVLHLDIKPGNVLVTRDGDVRLIDFGIAALLDTASSAAGTMALTLSTAAPEQLAMQGASTATDIFQTGMLAHLLLAGSLPRRQSDGSVTIDREALRDADLAAILARATAADPAARYHSIDALGEDLQAWIDGAPVAAREGGALYRMRRFVGRYRFASSMAALALVALTGGLAVSLWQMREAQTARDLAEYEAAEAIEYGTGAAAREEIMLRAFNTSADQDRLLAFLDEYHQQALAERESNPEGAAAINAAIAQHLFKRNDYRRALTVLEPWVAEGYGSPGQLNSAKSQLARVLLELGRTDEAVAWWREVEQAAMASPGRYRADHAANASGLAIASKDPADLAHAREVLLRTRELNPETAPPGYLENQLAVIERLDGNFPAAIEWMREALPPEDPTAAESIAGQDTSWYNMAALQLYALDDPLAAAQSLSRAERLSRMKGPSQTLGSILLLRGEMMEKVGRHAEAEDLTRQGMALLAEFVGTDAPYYARGLLVQARQAARRGDAERAIDLVDRADAIAQGRPNDISLPISVRLVRLELGQVNRFTLTAEEERSICGNPGQLRLLQQLAQDGLAQRIACLDNLS